MAKVRRTKKVVVAKVRKEGERIEALVLIDPLSQRRVWQPIEIGDTVSTDCDAHVYVRENSKKGVHIDVWAGKGPHGGGGMCERKYRHPLTKDGVYCVRVDYEMPVGWCRYRPFGWVVYYETPLDKIRNPLKRVVRELGLPAGKDEFRQFRPSLPIEVGLFYGAGPIDDEQYLISDGDVSVTKPEDEMRIATIEGGTYALVVTEYHINTGSGDYDNFEERYKIDVVYVRDDCDPEVLRAALKEAVVPFDKDFQNYPRH